MKAILLYICSTLLTVSLFAQDDKIVLDPPNMERGLPVMKALSLRASVHEFDSRDLGGQDLSDLLWAADGINRPESGMRTAPSAYNAQDIDIYVFMKTGAYLYDPKEHELNLVAGGDHRDIVAYTQDFVAVAPVICVLVSDISRFSSMEDSMKLFYATADAGIVSQNINIFCASTGLATRPRATMNKEKLREVLNLKDTQYPMLNNAVSYKEE